MWHSGSAFRRIALRGQLATRKGTKSRIIDLNRVVGHLSQFLIHLIRGMLLAPGKRSAIRIPVGRNPKPPKPFAGSQRPWPSAGGASPNLGPTIIIVKSLLGSEP